MLEYRKLDDFRYSALGFVEFCEIHPRQARDSEAQGVTVKQQASGLLRNTRPKVPYWVAVKPPSTSEGSGPRGLWKIATKWLILLQ